MNLFYSSLATKSSIPSNLFQPQGGDITDELQSFIDDNVNNAIIIGLSRATTYKIDKPLHIPSDSEIEINATIKIADSNIRDLTADCLDGTDRIYTANADQYFKIGQVVIVSDDAEVLAGGGDWKTRKRGIINWVTGITSTYIQCRETFSNSNNGGWTVAENAKVGQYNPALYFFEKDNITLTGKGLLDGNWNNQYGNVLVGSLWDSSFEALDGGSGIVQRGSTNISVSGIEILDFVLHNVSIWYGSTWGIINYYCDYSDIILDGSGEKNMACIGYRESTLTDIINRNGRDEGEIALYSNNQNVICTNITSINNRRHGLSVVGNNQSGIEIYNFIGEDNQLTNLYIQDQALNDVKIDGVTLKGLGAVSGSGIAFSGCSNFAFVKNINITDAPHISTMIGFTNCSNILVEDVIINDCDDNSKLTIAVGVSGSSDIKVLGINIDIIDRCFNDGVGNSNIVIENAVVDNYNLFYWSDNGAFSFINLIDNQNP